MNESETTMTTKPTTYEPTEYEQMLIVAGWVTIESLDSEYLEYVQRVGKYEADGYEGWRSSINEMVSLNQLWDTVLEPVILGSTRTMTSVEKELERQIIERMSFLEMALGY